MRTYRNHILLLILAFYLFVFLTPTVVHAQNACDADINTDSIVDLRDYSLLVANFFSTSPDPARTDINTDGIVDLRDYSVLVANFFSSCQQEELPELLDNPDFEEPFSSTAPSWNLNVWSGASASTSQAQGYDSAQAQRVQVSSLPEGSGVYFRQFFTFEAGRIYEFSVNVRSQDGVDVRAQMRKDSPYYNVRAVKSESAVSSWQTITIIGGFDEQTDGSVGIYFLTSGEVEIDDASLTDVTERILKNAVPDQPVPDHFMGMIFNKPGTLSGADYLPQIGYGIVRLWDDVITWKDIEPEDDAWDFYRFDVIMNHLLKYDWSSDTKILYTLGMTPDWARVRTSDVGSPPSDIDEWREYVRTVAQRYQGKIQYYELWNEADYDNFSTITAEEFITLAQAAREELLAVDPTIQLVSMNVTGVGMPLLDEFLFLGGGQYIDILAYHAYIDARYPEDSIGQHYGIVNLRDNYSLTTPVWNTEGAPQYDAYGDAQIDRAAAARFYLTQWPLGVENVMWYTWDIHSWGGNVQVRLSTDDYLDTRPAGIAYREVSSWLVGSTTVATEVTGDLWHLTLRNADGTLDHILWRYDSSAQFTLPASWNQTTLHDLAGGVTDISSASTITVGIEPVRIRTTDIQ